MSTSNIKYLVNYVIFGYVILIIFYVEYYEKSIYMDKLRYLEKLS